MILNLVASVVIYLCIICLIGVRTIDHSLKGFDDSILFKLNWPGKDGVGNWDLPEFEKMMISTVDNEKYECLIPQLLEKETKKNERYNGPSPIELLSPLFTQSSCSYRLEAYWTYELCHGKYVRQYHEEREGKKVKLQEYFLGKWDSDEAENILRNTDLEEQQKLQGNIPVKKIDGLNMPYIQLNMSDGTLCDLSSKARLTKVLYVCYAHGKHEIYSLKETSICEYEVIVLSPLLCSHPRYRPQESGEHVINCLPAEIEGKKPKSLLQFEAESLKLRHQKDNDDKGPNLFAVFSVDKVAGQDGESRVRVEIHPVEAEEADTNLPPTMALSMESTNTGPDATLKNFVDGKDCLNGGSGWWRYEFCYGKSVVQYHAEKDGSKTIVNLGNFDKAAHLEWLANNPHKRPKHGGFRRYVAHFYTGGSLCDKTGKPRQTEVKLKCMDMSAGHSPGSVSLYLLEPKTCQYVLGIESQLMCELIEKVDLNGLLYEDVDDMIGFSRADSSRGYRPYQETGPEQGGERQEQRKDKPSLLVDHDDLDNHIPDGDE